MNISLYTYICTHTKLNVCINAYSLQNIHTQEHKTNLNTYSYLNIPIVNNQIKNNVKINCNLLGQEIVNSSPDSSSLIFDLRRNKGSLIFDLRRNKGKDFFFQIHVGNYSTSLADEKKWQN